MLQTSDAIYVIGTAPHLATPRSELLLMRLTQMLQLEQGCADPAVNVVRAEVDCTTVSRMSTRKVRHINDVVGNALRRRKSGQRV